MPMSAETSRAELIVPKEPRMLGAVEAVVNHAAEQTGLSESAQKGLAAAAIQACEQALELAAEVASEEPKIHVIVENFDDRVEVTFEHPGAAKPVAGVGSFAGSNQPGTGKIRDAPQTMGVDRVQYETKGGVSRTRLIKYAEGKAPRH